MCGIAGRFAPAGLTPDPDWRARADAALAHRGPDGSGEHADAVCELVHRRLALLDLSPTGAQPMANEDGQVLIVFNGQVYNHDELRAEVRAAGHTLRGTSDTEVLVHLYEQHGEQFVARLRGMFALALYDRRASRLLLARDRFGIKPLYLWRGGGEWVFASELKAITARAAFVPAIDRQAICDYLGLMHVPEPATAFAGVCAVERGTTVIIDERGVRTLVHARPRVAIDDRLTLDDAAERAGDLLLDATRWQLRADVPVAALLSGGIDSSLVVAAACQTGARPETFNVRFPEAGFDETPLALAVAQRYGTRHHTIDLDGRITIDEVMRLLAHHDQPFADSSLIPTYQVSRAIRERGIICTLSGDGGDEAFGGYHSYLRLPMFAAAMRLPRPARSALMQLGWRVAPYTTDRGRQLAKAMRVALAARGDTRVLLAGLANYLTPEDKHALAPDAAGLADSERLYGPFDPPGAADLETLSARLTESGFAGGLVSDMLRKVDMMSMMASIEVRVPMLDERMVALGLSLPHRLRARGRAGKRVLRRLAERWLPRGVVDHPKQGFAIPLDRMVDERFHAVLREHLLAPDARVRGFLDATLIARWLELFRAGGRGVPGTLSRGGIYQRAIMLLALELWMRKYRLSW